MKIVGLNGLAGSIPVPSAKERMIMGGYAAGRKVIGDSGSEETVWVYTRETMSQERYTELQMEDDSTLLFVKMTVADWEWLKTEADSAIAFLNGG